MRHLAAEGIIVTTTGFTAGAVDLAVDEELALFTLRPFLPADADGRVKKLVVTMRSVMPVPDKVQVAPAGATHTIADGDLVVCMDSLVVSGSTVGTFRGLLCTLMPAPLDRDVSIGEQTNAQVFNPPVVVQYGDRQLELGEIAVKYHVEVGEHTFTVDAGKKVAELNLRSWDSSYDRVVWSHELQQYLVEPGTGIVVPRPGRP